MPSDDLSRVLECTFLDKSPVAKGLKFVELILLAFEKDFRREQGIPTRVYRPGAVERINPWRNGGEGGP